MSASKILRDYRLPLEFPNRMNVLVVDSDDEARAATSGVLQDCGYQVVEETSARGAFYRLTGANRGGFHAAVTEMRHLDVDDVFDFLRRSKGTVPIIVVSSNILLSERKRLYQYGVILATEKPLNPGVGAQLWEQIFMGITLSRMEITPSGIAAWSNVVTDAFLEAVEELGGPAKANPKAIHGLMRRMWWIPLEQVRRKLQQVRNLSSDSKSRCNVYPPVPVIKQMK